VKYIHDCSECIYLGDYVQSLPFGVVDLYFHHRTDGLRSEAVFRYGDEGWDYCSTSQFHQEFPFDPDFEAFQQYAQEALKRMSQRFPEVFI
jgi:hypothetical protein